jgi:hypothetical protein
MKKEFQIRSLASGRLGGEPPTVRIPITGVMLRGGDRILKGHARTSRL